MANKALHTPIPNSQSTMEKSIKDKHIFNALWCIEGNTSKDGGCSIPPPKKIRTIHNFTANPQ